jgi:proteasome lid subunit RPN8/RPN11
MTMEPSTAPRRAVVETSPEVSAALRSSLGHGASAEPCGYLLGRRTDSGIRVERVVRGENVHSRPHASFLLAPEEQLTVRKAARAAGLDFVGFWHGHPHGPPRPSHADLAGMNSGAPAWMLIAGREGRGGPVVVRAWRIADGQATEARLTSSASPPRPLPR